MKISIYSTAFNIIKYNFDYKDALDNWFVFAEEVVVSVNTSKDDTYEVLLEYAKKKNYNLVLNRTDFSYDDPFCYGKIENSALQKCSGDVLIQQNLDERLAANPKVLMNILETFNDQRAVSALFVPTIDLFGDKNKYINIGRKWYIHKRGLNRGPVYFGIKDDNRPDYNKTSTDELIDSDGRLVPTHPLIDNLDINNLTEYSKQGYPVVFHLGYLNLKDRLERAIWWKDFWNKATGGDENKHPTTMEELINKNVFEHKLDLWTTKKV